MATPAMPPRGHATAPTFDEEQPRTLRRFFQDLEALFDRCAIADEQQKKKWVTRYLPIDAADLCESLGTFAAPATYEDFKKAIIALYPGADDARKHSVADVEALVNARARTVIQNIGELSTYYRDFFAMTSYLISHNRLSTSEQSRLFVRGLRSPLWDQVSQRLQLKQPDHYPDDPYALTDVFDAAKFVLHGTTVTGTATASRTSSTPAESSTVKVEDLAPLLKLLAKSISDSGAQAATGSQPVVRNSEGPVNNFCHYCGDPGDRVATCKHVDKDIKAGRIMRNAEGKIVLPNGNFVPRSLAGITMRDRVYEWHRLNPGQMRSPSSQMMLQFAPSSETTSAFQLTSEDRIAQLEREILALRSRRAFDGVELPAPRYNRPRTPPATGQSAPANRATSGSSETSSAKPTTSVAAPPRPPTPHPASEPSATVPTPANNTAPTRPAPVTVEHPFAKARDATHIPSNYTPPTDRNFATAAKDKESTYRTQVPIHQPKIADDIFARSMKTPTVTLTPEELLSIAPEVRAKYREAITPKRVITESRTVAFVEEVDEENAVVEQSCSGEPLEPGGVIIPDPFEVYLRRLEPGSDPTLLTVAKESHALRAIMGLVDNKEYVEAIIDPGSQIIAMSEHVCHALGLSYDPTIRLNMQSANGEVDQSLGLVRNVPFCVANIVLYLQMHVIRAAAYDILLGRPFDVLTRSVVKNFHNEDQTITIKCPNTGTIATIPTIARGSAQFRPSNKSQLGFRPSMI